MPVLRLAGLLCAAGLAASRLGLLLHELLGHGGFAVAQGGSIDDLRLFWFAGGWISYSIDDPSTAGAVATSMGGLIVELVVGGALWLGLANRDREPTRLGIRILRGIGAAITAHACWYFATGTWHGYGDGLPSYRGLGDARYPIAIAAGVVTCALAHACARLVLGMFVVIAKRRTNVAIALAIAAVVLAAPVVIEMQLRSDNRYGVIMKREGDRLADREIAQWKRELARTRTPIDPALLEAERERRKAQHREPPFMPVLAVLVLVSIILGARRAHPSPGAELTRRHLVIASIAGLGSLLAVIAIDAAFH